MRQYWSAAASTIAAAAAAYVPKNSNFVYFVVGVSFFFGFLD